MAALEKQDEVLIVNRRTGKALQCTGLDNGQVVVQAAPSGEDAQVWSVVKGKEGVKLMNKASGKVLDVMHGSTEAGAWVQTWEDVDGQSQVWKLARATATYKKIVNTLSGNVLDIVDMREDDGAPTQIWEDVEGLGQQWKLVELAEFARKGIQTRTHSAKSSEPDPAEAPAPKAPRAKKAAAQAAAPVEAPVKAPAKRGRKPKAEAAPKAEAPKAPAKRGRKPANKT
ncbi:RICIN domain-containing protein [Oscillospiraceae bacterium 42-9]